ncbi:hypothetical protein KC356_g2520, partial [Hortaea werneckii]
MPIKTPSDLPPNSSCPPSILIRGITPSSTSPPNGNTSSPLLEFSPPLTTIPLHLWTNLSWVPSPISALLGTPLKLARFPAAAATSTTVNTNPDESPPPSSASSGAKTSPARAEHDGQAGGQQTEVQEEQAGEEEADGDFQLIAPLLPFFLEIDPEDVATFGKVRLNWLQGTVIVSSAATTPSFTTNTTTTTSTAATTTDGTGAAGADAADAATQPPDPAKFPTGNPPSPNEPPHQHQPLHPRLLAQMVQYLNGPVFRAIKGYRKLDPLQSGERRVRAREIFEKMFCPRAFEG